MYKTLKTLAIIFALLTFLTFCLYLEAREKISKYKEPEMLYKLEPLDSEL